MDPELLNAIRDLLGSHSTVRELATSEANVVIEDARAAFVEDPNVQWWWSSLRQPAARLAYGHGDGLAVSASVIHPGQVVRLVVTDDDSANWPVFEGPFQDINAILRQLRFFEYFMVPPTNTWILFDTHDNHLIAAGSLSSQLQAVERR